MGYIGTHTKQDGTISYKASIRKTGFEDMFQSFSTEQEAQAWIDQTEKALSLNINPKFKLMKDMFDRYEQEVLPTKNSKNRLTQVQHIKFWRAHLDKFFITEVNSVMIELIANTLYKKTSRRTNTFLSPETRRKYLMTLSYIFSTACLKWKWLEFNPVISVDKHKKTQADRPYNVYKGETFVALKTSFIQIIKDEMKKRNITAWGALARELEIPKTSMFSLLDPENNSTCSQMTNLANKLGLKLTLVVTKS